MSRPRWYRVILAALLLAGTTSALPIVAPVPAQAAGAYQLLGEGLDSCAAPSITQMEHFWTSTPYYYWGIYIGGSQRACSQPNLTPGWIGDVMSGSSTYQYMAWKLLPFWVGPQDPCEPGFGSYISYNTTTAFNQGESEAASAYDEWVYTLGQNASTPIEYDMEYSGSTITSSCLAAIKAFVNGWVTQMHLPPAQKAGLYTSTCAGDLDQFAYISQPPDYVDGANYNGNPSTSNLPCVSSSHWVYQQRHKQYTNSHYETWNGSTILVDNRCANSWVYATYSVQNTSEGCA